MTEIRQRVGQLAAADGQTSQKAASEAQLSESEEEEISEPTRSVSEQLPQASDKTTEVLDNALKGLHPRWRNWIVRGIFAWVMLGAFAFCIYLGVLPFVLVILALQIMCYHEIITIGHVVYRMYKLPWFRVLSWYFLFVCNFFFCGESLIDYFGLLMSRRDFLRPFVTYRRFFSFSLYIAGFVAFVFSLVKKFYFKQFTLFGYAHVALMLIVFQSHFSIQNLLDGFIWFLVPVCMIICNDIMAYIFGFFFGKTPLIKLSPKKTWEGFIGGAFSTIIFGVLLSHIMCEYDYFVCPVTYDDIKDCISMECERSWVFIPKDYKLPDVIRPLFTFVGLPRTFQLYPFVVHSISMSVFASFLGPFGGFFASGLKRAYKIKDFGDTIPGHGGFVDRFDCQFLMATFVHVYNYSFIQMPNTQKLLQSILMLPADSQVALFHMLQDKLLTAGIIANNTLT